MALSPEERKQLKVKLLNKIERTESKIGRMESMTRPVVPENAIGRLSRMDAISNKSVMEAALRMARLDLDAMNAALRRLDTGQPVGICERCGKQIPFQRLALIPGSTKCVYCA